MTVRNILDAPSFVPPALNELYRSFTSRGYELVLVGGCVRDTLVGKTPKDIDLATSATPEEQIALYREDGYRFIETGLQHGTVTVIVDDEPYEITTYRIDRETDGRHATVEYTRDLEMDLARRDLTFNAIAMKFDGTLIDPFAGAVDLKEGRVRFVGEAKERIEEDYLRILRFFRFYGRFGRGSPDRAAMKAIKRSAQGLRRVSVERIWMEMAKIVSGPQASLAVSYMRDVGVLEVIGMPEGFVGTLTGTQIKGVTNPASIMGWFVNDPSSLDELATAWKWSTEDRKRAKFVATVWRDRYPQGVDMAFFKRLVVDGHPFEWVSDVMRVVDFDPAELANWEVPVMPVTGADLLSAGMKAGPEMGRALAKLKEEWAASDYTLDKEALMTYL